MSLEYRQSLINERNEALKSLQNLQNVKLGTYEHGSHASWGQPGYSDSKTETEIMMENYTKRIQEIDNELASMNDYGDRFGGKVRRYKKRNSTKKRKSNSMKKSKSMRKSKSMKKSKK